MLYEIAKPAVAGVIRLVWRPRIEGTGNIPDEGPVVLASNHLTYADTVFLPALVRRTVHFLGKSDMFASTSLASRASGALLRSLHVMPVDRSGGSASAGAIAAGLAILERGEVLGIYPEGTRSPDGTLHRGKTGAVRLALEGGAPIVPVAMLGAFEAQRGRRFLPRRSPRITIRVGEPIDVAALAAEAPGDRAEALRSVTDHVMDEIARMSGQARTEEYAADVKRRLRSADAGQRLRRRR